VSQETLLNVKQVAEYLHQRVPDLFVAQMQIPAIKIGPTWRFRRKELDTWLSGI
jgi:excisionase family DNA binding protein